MSVPKSRRYEDLSARAAALLEGEANRTARAANFVALINQVLEDINWVGFYFVEDDALVLGPFQGRVACYRIPFGQGVCGTVAERRETLFVTNVQTFPGHITCDINSKSEVVVPVILADGTLIGVLDLDSPSEGRFDAEDAEGLERLVEVFARSES